MISGVSLISKKYRKDSIFIDLVVFEIMGSSEGLGASSKPANSSSQAVPEKKYGVTKAISMAGPTSADRKRTQQLEKV